MDFAMNPMDTKRCSVCKEPSARMTWPEVGNNTFFGLLTFGKDEIGSERSDLTNRSWGLMMYACTNPKCNHIDLFHVGLRLADSQEILP